MFKIIIQMKRSKWKNMFNRYHVTTYMNAPSQKAHQKIQLCKFLAFFKLFYCEICLRHIFIVHCRIQHYTFVLPKYKYDWYMLLSLRLSNRYIHIICNCTSHNVIYKQMMHIIDSFVASQINSAVQIFLLQESWIYLPWYVTSSNVFLVHKCFFNIVLIQSIIAFKNNFTAFWNTANLETFFAQQDAI